MDGYELYGYMLSKVGPDGYCTVEDLKAFAPGDDGSEMVKLIERLRLAGFVVEDGPADSLRPTRPRPPDSQWPGFEGEGPRSPS